VIVAIVEGQGDAEGVPTLARRLVLAAGGFANFRPHRVKRHKVVKPGELERVIEFAAMQEECDGILVVLDADDDCPVDLARDLLERAITVASHLPISVVIANREFEAWIIAGIEGTRGQRGIPTDAECPSDPDAGASPKGYLDRLMVGRTYLETDDQAAFAERLNPSLARTRSRSFRKFEQEVLRLAAAA